MELIQDIIIKAIDNIKDAEYKVFVLDGFSYIYDNYHKQIELTFL